MQKMKVLRIIARLNVGGPAVHTILLSRHMASLGYETLLMAGRVGPEEGDMIYLAETLGVEPLIIPQLGRRVRPIDDVVGFFRILRILFEFRPDFVHTHTAKAGTLGRLAAFIYNTTISIKCSLQKPGRRIPQCKVIHTFHGNVLRGYFSPFTTRIFQLIEKGLARITHAIVVVSSQQKEELCNKFSIGRPAQYRVIPLGFDLTPFSQCTKGMGAFRARFGITENDVRLIGIVGRLSPIKNHRLFLEAAHILVKNHGDTKTRFLIIGDGELRRDCEELSAQLGLSERIVFTGWIKNMVPIYEDLDILALSSDNEGTPVTVIEAMAAGVPVVATDAGSVRELVGRWETGDVALKQDGFEICERGVLVKRGDVESFARGLHHLLHHPEVCRKMGQRGKDYALKHYSKEQLIVNMHRLYQELLQ